MKIAVTAASGALGSSIVKALLNETSADNVIAVARTPAKAEYLGVEVRQGDYKEPEQLEKAFQDVEAVLLVSGMDDPKLRIGQHRNVINAAKKAGVKKIVYTSIQGAEEGNAFSPVVQSNRQTEQDIKESGLNWAIGRNGIYIEPDVEYIDSYKKIGAIKNCAGEGKCGYTTRGELGIAYAQMLLNDKLNGQIYNLHGETLTQSQLVNYMNKAFNTNLTYVPMTKEAFQADRIAELGDFLGTVITGIYEGIAQGACNNQSDFEKVTGRPHQSWENYFKTLNLGDK